MGLFDYLASDVHTPADYDTLDMRRRIALAMIGRDKKGYPRNVGEGLTAIGDAIGERAQMAAFERINAAYQQKAAADAGTLKLGGPAAAPPAARPPGPQASLPPATDTGADATPTASLAQDIAPATEQLPPEGVASLATASPEEGGYTSIDAAAATDPWPARRRAIAGIESGGERDPYAAVSIPTRGDRAYGKYQIMGANIPEWTQAALGTRLTPAQFLQNPSAQEGTFENRFGNYVNKYGEGGAARAWYGGEGGMNNLGATDAYGRLNVGQYGQDYLKRLARASAGGPSGPSLASAPPDTAVADAAGAARLSDVVSLEKGDTGAYAYPRTALRGDMQSDAPESGISPTGISAKTGAAAADTIMQARDKITKAALLRQMQPPAPGVPPVNPTLPGVVSPPQTSTPISAAAAGTPVSAIDAAPPTPIPVAGQRLAQGPTLTQQPTPAMNKPKNPDPAPYNDMEQKGWAMSIAHPNPQDPLHQQGLEYMKIGAAARAKQDADNQEQFRLDYQTWAARSNPQALEELKKTQNENALRAQFGNQDPAEVYKILNSSKTIAKGAQQSLSAAAAARKALDGGAILGSGANQRLDFAKLVTALGFVDKGSEIANTETFRGAMQPIVANILHQTSGTSQLSEGELRFANAAAAGNIVLEPKSIRMLLDIIDKRSNEIINDHQTMTDALFGRDNPQARALFGVEAPVRAAAPGGVVDVGSEAEAAKLPKGTKVRINGRTGTVQ